MKSSPFTPVALTILVLTGAGCYGEPRPPVAKVVPKTIEKHGYAWNDEYHWLWERENPEVLRYLAAENRYTAAMMAHTETLQKMLFEEFKGRIQQTGMSVPYMRGGYLYYSRTEAGKEYPIFCRKKGTDAAPEQIVLDVNQLAAGHKYFRAGPVVSPDGNIAAIRFTTTGSGIGTICFKDLQTGVLLKDVITNVTASVEWANDNTTLFYVKQHPQTLRTYRIYRHDLGTDPVKDELVYEEKDERYYCDVGTTKSGKYLLIGSSSLASSEYRYLDADAPRGALKLFLARQPGLIYSIDHHGDYFYIRTNLNAKNFRVMKTPVTRTTVENWTEVIPHRTDCFLEGIDIFKDHLVVQERSDALVKLRIMPWSGARAHYVDFGEPAYSVYASDNHQLETPVVRYRYASLTTPMSVYDYNMVTREKKLVKQEEVLGGFATSNYQTERVHAAAPDGARVPITLVYRRGFRKDGRRPLLLAGYGAYGYSEDASFDPFLISLLDRGFVYAIAHIRGGGELGQAWHDQGRLLNKKNTFTDFIACAEFLVREKYADRDKLFATGMSAGGLLMGVVANMRPDLFKGVLATVPAMDFLTESVSEGAPPDSTENDEWGDLSDKKVFDYVRSYSPYHNLKAQSYPNFLVTTSFQDASVSYWSPAKWVAKLRATKTDNNRLLLKAALEGGHSGASGRDTRYRDTAFEYAFILDLAGIRQ
jgi:oligopeptidase B